MKKVCFLMLVLTFAFVAFGQINTLTELRDKTGDISGAVWKIAKIVVIMAAAWLFGTSALELFKTNEDKMRSIGKMIAALAMVLFINVLPSIITSFTGQTVKTNTSILGSDASSTKTKE